MNTEEFKTKNSNLEHQLKRSKSRLAKEYAFSNNDISKGEFVCDSIGKILVDMIQVTYSFGSSLPECVYTGIEYTKKDKPMKSGSRRSVYQSNLI